MRPVLNSLLLLSSLWPLTGHSAPQQPLITLLPPGAEKPVLRRGPGLKSLTMLALTTLRAPHLALGTSYHFTARCKGQLALGLAIRKQKGKRCRQAFLAPSLLYLLYTTHRRCFLSLKAGPLITYRWQQAPRKRGHFHVGLLVGLEGELFLYRSFSVSLEAAPCYYLLKSPYPPLDYILTLGLSYTF
ncbi:MAG: hypothetical protein ROO73_01255 [Roseivirga sp.]